VALHHDIHVEQAVYGDGLESRYYCAPRPLPTCYVPELLPKRFSDVNVCSGEDVSSATIECGTLHPAHVIPARTFDASG
jgi:hypothetical protein